VKKRRFQASLTDFDPVLLEFVAKIMVHPVEEADDTLVRRSMQMRKNLFRGTILVLVS
jgi:hypothetical protein